MILYNLEAAEELFQNHAILIKNRDVIPEDRAVSLLGADAIEFAKRMCPDGFNGYGIGFHTMFYLTKQGFLIAVTHCNVANLAKSK